MQIDTDDKRLSKLKRLCSLNLKNFLLLSISIAIILIFNLGEIQRLSDSPPSTDFFKFYLSSKYLISDKPIYWSAPDRSLPNSHCNSDAKIAKKNKLSFQTQKTLPAEIVWCLHPNLNPPFFVLLTTPFALFDYSIAWWIWSIASMVSGLLALTVIYKAKLIPSATSSFKITLIGIGLFAYYPTFANSTYGQLTLFLLLLMTLAWVTLRNKNDYTSGFWLGLAASIKPFFGLFAITLLFCNNLRALGAFTLTYIIFFLIGGLATDFSSYTAYSKILNEVNWLATNWNGSYAGFYTRLLGGSGNQPMLDMPNVARGLSILSTLATLGILAFILLKQAKTSNPERTADILFALTLPAMLLISPLGWMYYYPLLLISLIVFWNLKSEFENSKLYGLLMLLALAPTVGPNPLIPLSAINTPKIWFWNAGMYFYLLIAIFGLTSFLAIKSLQGKNQNSRKDY